jgi:hypothetical protein
MWTAFASTAVTGSQFLTAPRPPAIPRGLRPRRPAVLLGEDGRFRIEGLVPGRRYTSRVVRRPGSAVGMLAADLAVAPGETRDLGDVSPAEAP